MTPWSVGFQRHMACRPQLAAALRVLGYGHHRELVGQVLRREVQEVDKYLALLCDLLPLLVAGAPDDVASPGRLRGDGELLRAQLISSGVVALIVQAAMGQAGSLRSLKQPRRSDAGTDARLGACGGPRACAVAAQRGAPPPPWPPPPLPPPRRRLTRGGSAARQLWKLFPEYFASHEDAAGQTVEICRRLSRDSDRALQISAVATLFRQAERPISLC